MRCIELDLIPKPNLLVSSGHGLHLYFLLKEPCPLYMRNHEVLNKLKKGLTDKSGMTRLLMIEINSIREFCSLSDFLAHQQSLDVKSGRFTAQRQHSISSLN